MSETEYLTGKLKQIYTDLPIEDACKELLVELSIPFDDECYDSYREFVDDNFYRDGYVVAKGKLFKIVECDEKDEWEDIFEATNNPDGTIDFVVKYYNGGCGFNEAIGYALDNLEEFEGEGN